MSQLYIASELESLLQLWEDQNLVGEFDFQMTRVIKQSGQKVADPKSVSRTEKMIGSELNPMGILMRAIPGYEKLRKSLMGVPIAHATNFLPTVPKDYRALATTQSLIDHQLVRGSISIPTFLQKWNETRRACIVEDTVPIPMLDLRQENWLEFLPYHAFYLKVRTPFVFPVIDEDRELIVEDFLIYDNGDVVSIMFWEKDISAHCLPYQQRIELHAAIASPKNDKLVNRVYSHGSGNVAGVNATCVCKFNITKKGALMRESRTQLFAETFIDFYHPDNISSDPKDIVIHRQMVSVVELINGFCKLTAALPPKASVHLEDAPDHYPPRKPGPRQWFELPTQIVQQYHTDELNKAVVLCRGAGVEKEPHYRRGHKRRLLQRDGTIVVIWVTESLVREDKIITNPLQGGALKIV